MKSMYINNIRLFVFIWILAGTALGAQAQSTLARAGKIWYADEHLYVNLINEGVMVIDNRNPRQPQKLGFISVPGSVDLAVRGNLLYANSNQDLVVVDISDLTRPRELHRLPNIFNHRPQSSGSGPNTIAWRSGSDFANILENAFRPFSLTPGTNRRNNGGSWLGNNGINSGGNPLVMSAAPVASRPASRPATSVGKGGSMACFTIVGNLMYAIDSRDLLVIDLSEAARPQIVGSKIPVSSDIETIFAYGQNLFIGGQAGMYIYNIQNPQLPRREGQYRHTRSCDPVVVEGNYAYVTLRNGSDCGGSVNQLDVIDISNPANPRKVKTYPMSNPHGLGIDQGLLFICDGYDGLKVYDASNPMSIDRNRLAHFKGINAYDLIPDTDRKVVMMVGSNKITQYNYANMQNLELLSELDLSSTSDIRY